MTQAKLIVLAAAWTTPQVRRSKYVLRTRAEFRGIIESHENRQVLVSSVRCTGLGIEFDRMRDRSAGHAARAAACATELPATDRDLFREHPGQDTGCGRINLLTATRCRATAWGMVCVPQAHQQRLLRGVLC